MKLILALEQQTAFDIALQELGSAEAVMDLILDNDTITLDTELASGQELIINRSVSDASITDHYTANRIKPGNGVALTIQVLGTSSGRAIKTNTGKYIKIKIKK